MRFLQKYIKNKDRFSHKVQLVYKRQEDKEKEYSDEYRTEIGGILTIMIECMFIACCCYYFWRMYQKIDNKNT